MESRREPKGIPPTPSPPPTPTPSSLSLSPSTSPLPTPSTSTTQTNDRHLVVIDRLQTKRSHNRKQFSSFVLFLSVVIIVNLCPFHNELDNLSININNNNEQQKQEEANTHLDRHLSSLKMSFNGYSYVDHLETCLKFVKLMFSNPIRLSKRTTRFTQAEARVLGKMAKVWYIKKKIKKLSKKLKKHTIAVPVFTAIPIYEHSYYPQPHVTHVSHHGMHHAAAASSYSPAAISPVTGATTSASGSTQQLATSASNNHQQVAAYRMSGHHPAHHHHPAMYHPMAAGSHQIINSYAPSQPLFMDESGGLYGHYGNAYGRYDGGYHVW